MSNHIVGPGEGIIVMKVGVHAQEPLEEIIARKSKEIDDAGFAFWGYGGNTCHPVTMVQPFAKSFAEQGKRITLCMQEMDSRHFAEQVRAEYYSEDGQTWQPIPAPINVLGSRFALAIRGLHRQEFDIPLANTHVGVGVSRGRPGNAYMKGQVDKACLEFGERVRASPNPDEGAMKISLVAELCEPYAVFLKD